MTQLQDNDKEKPKEKQKINRKNVEKSQLAAEDSNATCTLRKFLAFCAWLISGLGLCIILTIFYLALRERPGDNDVIAGNDKVLESRAKLAVFADVAEGLSAIEHFRLEEYDNGSEKTFNKSERFSLANLYDKIDRNLNRCKENSCQIACANVPDVFQALQNIIKTSLCASIDVFLLEKQNFPLGVVENNWPPANMSFNEVIIRFGTTTLIKSAAFNASLFHNTLVLSLYSRNALSIGSGALLGLKRLKYLTIQSHVKKFQANILQPVQSTLLSFKLNGRLNIRGTENLFNGSFLSNLTYLDLSHNIFDPALGKQFFESTPNLKYLIITRSQMQRIEWDAFAKLADKLLFLNLAQNRFTTLSAGIFEPILRGHRKAVINLAENNWICNCQLKKFTELYKTYSLQFVHVLYCRGPHHLYGAALDEVDFGLENCLAGQNTVEVNDRITTTTITENTTPLPFKLKLRCFDEEHNTSSQQSKRFKRQVRSATDPDLDMEFPPPDYNFDLELIAKNNSANVTIENPSETYLVMWFSEEQESSIVSYAGKNLNYECRPYDVPSLIIGPLQANITYTFCVLSSVRNDVSPFNCLPLYVPPQLDQNIWISEDHKHLTIGMLCLIFLLSTLAGAGIAYLGFKVYPDLLQGSKNVAALKKSDHTYVTTISEIEYQKQTSLQQFRACGSQQSKKKLPLPETPPADNSPALCRMSVKDLERISGVKSSSICFEDTLPGYSSISDGYEAPKHYSDECVVQRRNIENTYCARPGSPPPPPPPLPKRNSNISNSSTLLLNRLSKS